MMEESVGDRWVDIKVDTSFALDLTEICIYSLANT